jgi:hypothetical protein
MEAAVGSVASTFERFSLVALGERHWAREDARFRLKLIEHPAFTQLVDDIVIEFANPVHQALLDSFVTGNDVPMAELRSVWQDTTQPGTWDSPVYEEFIVAVRSINASRPSARRLRILAADYPIDWGISPADALSKLDARDEFAAALIEKEVLRKNRKALLLFGSAHLYRNRPGTVINLLRDDFKAAAFVVVPIGGPDLPASITAIQATVDTPALLTLNSILGDLAAAEVLERGSKRIKVSDGKPVFLDGKPVLIPVFEEGVRIGELADACLYFGSTLPEFVEPPPILYEGTPYGKELQRRRRLLMCVAGLPASAY